MKSIKGSYILLVVLFPLFFAFHGYAENFYFVPVRSIAELFLKYFLLSVIVFLLFQVIYRNPVKAGIAFFITSAIYYSFGFFHDLLLHTGVGSYLPRYIFLLPLLAIIFSFSFWKIKKASPGFKWINYFNILLVVWILIDIVSIGVKSRKDPLSPLAVQSCDSCLKPDVHMILIDGYAGKEQLQKEFQFDNRIFLDSLRSIGFRMPQVSLADYPRTEFSVSSMLNMDYHERTDFTVTPESLKFCSERISRNQVVSVFQRLGYTFINNSIFDIAGQEAPVESYFLLNGKARIERATLFGRIKNDVYLTFLHNRFPNSAAYRKLVYDMLESDKIIEKRLFSLTTKRSDKPRFIYSHLLFTHFPYYYKAPGVFNEDSNINLTNYQRKDLYLNNLKAINNRLLGIVNNIIDNSAKPPLIILMSDHGFRYGDPQGTFSNLLAVYSPGKELSMPDTMNNVNLFRLVFHDIYGQQLPLLPLKK